VVGVGRAVARRAVEVAGTPARRNSSETTAAARPLGRAARDRFRADHVGVSFQQFHLLPWLTAEANVRLGCQFSKPRRRRAGGPGAAARGLLRAMDLPEELAGRRAGALSTGQQQRAAAARALIGQPELILADEPTSALDADTRDDFLALLDAERTAAGAALLFVSHDASLAARFDRRLTMAGLGGRADAA